MTTATVHPLAAPRRHLRRIAIVSSTVILLTGTWALWPLGNPSVEVPAPPPQRPLIASATTTPFLDLAAFSAPVWDAPPIPPKAVAVVEKPPPPPPPPLKLQLLGIVRDESLAADGTAIYIAAIYDEVADKLLMLRAGDSISTGEAPTGKSVAHGVATRIARITHVSAEAVEIAEPGSGTRRLALHQPLVPIPGLSAPLEPGAPSPAGPKPPAPKTKKPKP